MMTSSYEIIRHNFMIQMFTC